MNCVLVALTQDEDDKDLHGALGVATALAASREAEVRVLRIVQIPSMLPMDEPDLGDPRAWRMEEVSVFRDTLVSYRMVTTRDMGGCIEGWLKQLSPLTLVIIRDKLRWKGIWRNTTEHVARRFGVPVVVLRAGEAGGEKGAASP